MATGQASKYECIVLNSILNLLAVQMPVFLFQTLYLRHFDRLHLISNFFTNAGIFRQMQNEWFKML
jgi:hypothetical protein